MKQPVPPTTQELKRRLLLSKWQYRGGAARIEELEKVIETAKYWMQDVLVLRKPMGDPRKILTMLERAL